MLAKYLTLAPALTLAVALSAAPVAAQDTQALAEAYVALPNVQGLMDDLFSAESLSDSVMAQLPPTLAVTDDQKTRIGTVMSEAMSTLRPKMTALMISGSAETFSADELQALIAFYQSDHGAAIMEKLPVFMQSTMAQMIPDIQAIQREVGPSVEAILRE